MNLLTRPSIEIRKTPVQPRSVETIEAIFEATVQVLLGPGLERLTTTRVAARAGVSVGTLYQYFPNKQALLFALLERHFTVVAEAVEHVCTRQRGCPVDAMVECLVEAYVGAKLSHADASQVLYRIAAELNSMVLSSGIQQRSRTAIAGMLASAPDLHIPAPEVKATLLLSAMAGVLRAYLEADAGRIGEASLRRELVLLCRGYLRGE